MQGNNFLGEFKQAEYTVTKSYIKGQQQSIRLYFTRFTPPRPQKTLCVVHGFGQHSGRFHEIADRFCRQNYEVLLIDLTGFGYSGGPRGCATVDRLQNDIISLIKQARPQVPLFLYGHSLGGLLVIRLLQQRPTITVSGLIITSPLLGFPEERPLHWVKKTILKWVGDQMEDVIINSMVNPTALTKNNLFIQKIFQDRLMIPFLSVKMARSIVVAIDQAKQMPLNHAPTILFHGKKDTITNYKDSIAFAQANKLTLHLFDSGYHELQHDIQKDQMLIKGIDFLNSIQGKPFGTPLITLIHPPSKTNTNKIIFLLIAAAIIIKLILKIKRK